MNWFQSLLAFFASLFGQKTPPPPPPPPPDLILSDGVSTVRAAVRFGGAIYSIKDQNFEYLDSSDRGRLLQTAFQLNGRVEEENPTEGGTSSDVGKSSTVVKSGTTTGSNLTTVAQLAYWHPYNGQVLSPHLLRKDVTLNGKMLHHRITINIVGDQQAIIGEGLTAYLPRTFTRWHKFVDGHLVPLEVPSRPDQWNMVASDGPVIASSDDDHAIGCFSPQGGYAYGNIQGWPKWDAVTWGPHRPAWPIYNIEVYTVWGSLAEVTQALTRLDGS